MALGDFLGRLWTAAKRAASRLADPLGRRARREREQAAERQARQQAERERIERTAVERQRREQAERERRQRADEREAERRRQQEQARRDRARARRADPLNRAARDGRRRLGAALRSERLAQAFAERRLDEAQRARLAARLARTAYRDFRRGADLLDDGDLTASQWRLRMRRETAALAAAAAMAALGRTDLGPATREIVRRAVAEQWARLDRFAEVRGELTPKQVRARAANYARFAWSLAERVKLEAARAAGHRWARRHLGPNVERHCRECPPLAALGWVAIDEVVPIGETVCNVGCWCRIETSAAATKPRDRKRRRPAPAPAPVPTPPVDPVLARRRAQVEARLAEVRAELDARQSGRRTRDEIRAERAALEVERRTLGLSPVDLARLRETGDRLDALRREEDEARRAAYADAPLKRELAELEAWEARRQAIPTLVPPGPIRDRIGDYRATDGQEKLDAITAAADRIGEQARDAQRRQADLDRRIKALLREEVEVVARARRGEIPVERIVLEQDKILKQVNALERERDAVKAEVRDLERRAKEAARDAIRAREPIRWEWEPVGPGVASSDGPLAEPSALSRRSLDTAAEWLSSVVERGDAPAESLRYRVGVGVGYRPHYAGATRQDYQIQLGDIDGAGVVVHEVGHGLEHDLGLTARAREYLLSRARSQDTFAIQDRHPGSVYGPDERAYDADFARAYDGPDAARKGDYTAKDYRDGATEILSMGLEALYNDPAGLARRDPEFAAFLLGVLDGSLR